MNKFRLWLRNNYSIEWHGDMGDYILNGKTIHPRLLVGPFLEYIEKKEKDLTMGNMVEILTSDYPLEILEEIVWEEE